MSAFGRLKLNRRQFDGIERGLWRINFGAVVARIGEEPLELVFQGRSIHEKLLSPRRTVPQITAVVVFAGSDLFLFIIAPDGRSRSGSSKFQAPGPASQPCRTNALAISTGAHSSNRVMRVFQPASNAEARS
jgi:hypothetical protein